MPNQPMDAISLSFRPPGDAALATEATPPQDLPTETRKLPTHVNVTPALVSLRGRHAHAGRSHAAVASTRKLLSFARAQRIPKA